MNYDELIAKALKERSVLQASKDWQIPQPTLQRYVKGIRIPDYQTALIIAREAEVNAAVVMQIFAEEEAKKKPRSMFAEMGFAVAAILVSVNLFLTPEKAEAAPLLASQTFHEADTLYYVKLRRQLKAMRTWLKRLFSGTALQSAAR